MIETLLFGQPLHFWGHAMIALLMIGFVWRLAFLTNRPIDRALFIVLVAIWAMVGLLGAVYAIFVPTYAKDGIMLVLSAFIAVFALLILSQSERQQPTATGKHLE